MAKIIPGLNLNKSPQVVQPYSLVFAKNTKLDETGTSLVKDDCLKESTLYNEIESWFEGNQPHIVGCITTPKEVVAFVHINEYKNYELCIVRYNEEYDKCNFIFTRINYNDGEFIGTYNYNVRGELIIVFSEKNANKDVPLRTINLKKFINTTDTNYNNIILDNDPSYYNIVPDVPICQLKLDSLIEGINIPNGVYQFFIRYKYEGDLNSSWFPIGSQYFALSIEDYNFVNYPTESNAKNELTFPVNNINADCKYGFKLNINIDFRGIPIKQYDIGYIIRKENSFIGRLYNTFDRTVNTIIFDAKYREQLDYSEFLKSSFNIYNIENIVNYNSRIYISNYKEDNNNLNIDVSNIKVRLKEENYESDYTKVDLYNASFMYTSVSADEEEIGKKVFGTTTYDGKIYKENSNIIYYEVGFHLKFLKNIIKELNSIDEENDVDLYTKRLLGNVVKYDPIDIGNIKVKQYTANSSYGENKVVFIISNNDTEEETDTIYYREGNNTEAFSMKHLKISMPDSFMGYTYGITVTTEDKFVVNADYNFKNGSLKPGNVYNFFIHFVRKDGSYTNGLKLTNDATLTDNLNRDLSSVLFGGNTSIIKNKYEGYKAYELITEAIKEGNYYKFSYYKNNKEDVLFKVPMLDSNKRLVPIFLNVRIPDGYVGYFISYEKVENINLYIGKSVTGDFLKSLEAELGKVSFKGNIIKIKNTYYDIDTIKLLASNIHKDSLGKHGGLIITLNDEERSRVNTKDGICTVFSINTNVYSNKLKTLYRLTDIIDTDTCDENVCDYNYPSYLCRECFIAYKYGVIFYESDKDSVLRAVNSDTVIPENSKYYDDFGHLTEVSGINTEFIENDYFYTKYCDINLNAISIKQKPTVKITVSNKTTDRLHRAIRKFMDPAILYDALEIKEDYDLRTGINTLINYTNYDEDRPLLTQFDNTIRRSDVFANESIENTWRNFTGSNYKVISNTRGKIKKLIPLGKYFLIHLEQGLFVIDRDNKMKLQDKEIQLTTPDTFDLEAQEVYTSENGLLGLQNEDSAVISSYGYTFYENDTKTIYNYDSGKLNILSFPIQRLLENIDTVKVSMAFDTNNSRTLMCFELKDDKYFTISYNHLSKSFVSLHDFKFNKCWNTKVIPYLRTYDNEKIVVFTKEVLLNTYTSANLIEQNGENCKFNIIKDSNTNIFPAIFNRHNNQIQSYSIIDIIYNEGYDIPKVLNKISYILSAFNKSNDTSFQAEDNMKLEYSGDRLLIYTDRCFTDYQDISKIFNSTFPNSNNFDNTKPWNDKGVWNYNWFRNINDANELESDDMSLIYGKYFVIRFVFNPDTNFKLENLTCNINKY